MDLTPKVSPKPIQLNPSLLKIQIGLPQFTKEQNVGLDGDERFHESLHGRVKEPWEPTLTRPFPNGSVNAGS